MELIPYSPERFVVRKLYNRQEGTANDLFALICAENALVNGYAGGRHSCAGKSRLPPHLARAVLTETGMTYSDQMTSRLYDVKLDAIEGRSAHRVAEFEALAAKLNMTASTLQ